MVYEESINYENYVLILYLIHRIFEGDIIGLESEYKKIQFKYLYYSLNFEDINIHEENSFLNDILPSNTPYKKYIIAIVLNINEPTILLKTIWYTIESIKKNEN